MTIAKQHRAFFEPETHGLIRAAVAVPQVQLANPSANAAATIALARQASKLGAAVVLFPELGLSGYSNDDLFHQQALLEACLGALARLRDESRALRAVIVVGAPLLLHGRLYNCAVAIHAGRVLAVTPKTYLPSYREFYEKRQFSGADDAVVDQIQLLDAMVPFGNDVLIEAADRPGLCLHMELCEDLWTPIPPSTFAALGGATVLLNLSASNITIGKAGYRNDLCAAQSGKCIAAYLYSAAGPGESTNDLAWDGHAVIFEDNQHLAESERFARDDQFIAADIDLERLLAERMRVTSFGDAARAHGDRVGRLRRVAFNLGPAPERAEPRPALLRTIERFPYVPADAERRDERCWEAYHIQVHGLAQRLNTSGIQRIVIGVSGGLDSTQALLVAAHTMDWLRLPRSNILAYTLPGFATGEDTRDNAHRLMRALGVSAHEIDIRPSCTQMLQDLGHPFAHGEPVYDITFENVQAGERTSHLFRLANLHGALVLGTGDLSEIALGWSTYGVGDQMSHYNVNASVPKTLIQYLIRWVIVSGQFDADTNAVLQAILDTEISPELVPAGADGEPGPQSTEARIGPYALQDFNTYYISRYGLRPSKVAFLAWHAWHDRHKGHWPDNLPPERQGEYDLATIRRWLEVFLFRFFQTSQFKRTCMPNGPKVGSGGSLSPRGDWRAPSDASAAVWLAELREKVPEG